MRKLFLRALFILPLLVGSLFLFGQSQAEMNEEADASYRKADAALNASYKKLTAKLDAEGVKKLREAQRAWIAFRDAEAEAVSDDYRGGSMRPMIHSGILERLTRERTVQLDDRRKELESH